MEASTTTSPPETASPVAAPEPPEVSLFRYSGWVHIGPGADACDGVDEDKGEISCGDPLHFHAWCRLPNQFQHREIREKALAAKARKVRQLRDMDSDSAVVLEDELDRIARQGDTAKPIVIDELMSQDWWRDYQEAVTDIREWKPEDAAPDDPPPFALITQDQDRFVAIDELPDEDRDEDEFNELQKHLAEYNSKVDERQKEISAPRRQALEGRDINDLIDMIRDQRIDALSVEHFMHVYSVNEWLACTLTAPGGAPMFAGLEQIEQAAAEVIVALKAMFDDLERTQQQGNDGGGEGKGS